MTPHERWIDAQPEPVQAVLVIAELDSPERRIIAAGLFPSRVDDVEWIADRLGWVDRLESDVPAEVLGDWYGQPVHGPDLDMTAERLAEQCRADALLNAQLIADEIVRHRLVTA